MEQRGRRMVMNEDIAFFHAFSPRTSVASWHIQSLAMALTAAASLLIEYIFLVMMHPWVLIKFDGPY